MNEWHKKPNSRRMPKGHDRGSALKTLKDLRSHLLYPRIPAASSPPSHPFDVAKTPLYHPFPHTLQPPISNRCHIRGSHSHQYQLLPPHTRAPSAPMEGDILSPCHNRRVGLEIAIATLNQKRSLSKSTFDRETYGSSRKGIAYTRSLSRKRTAPASALTSAKCANGKRHHLDITTNEWSRKERLLR